MPYLGKGTKITDDESVIFIIQRYCQGEEVGVTPRILASKTGMTKREAKDKMEDLVMEKKMYKKKRGRSEWYYLVNKLLKRHGGVRR